MEDAVLIDAYEMFKDRDEAELIGHIQKMNQSDLKRYALPACNRLIQRRLNPDGRARLARIIAAVRIALEEQSQ